jgi:photosystem II stability/assembly factor-like uncharacterized protein
MRKLIELTILGLFFSGLAAGQAPEAGAPKAAPSARAAKAAEPKFKAIWEPVSFNRDIELTAISCAGPETCWVAGDKSTILFTSDGGTTWQAQLGGDPEAPDEDLAEIFFLDGKHGWVKTERSRLMATTDGSTWAEMGKLPATAKGLWFSSPQTGFISDNHDSTSRTLLNRTNDGGRTWTRGNPCGLDAMIDGLPRKLGCLMRDTQFVTPQAGFMGGGAAIAMGTSVAAFSKTTDGGGTWTSAVIPATKHRVDSIHFWSDKDGLVLLASGQTFWTADAGSTWSGSVNPPAWRSYYASGEGKLIVGVNQNGRQIGYSFNGGRNFTSRPANLPTEVTAVTFPDARHGYLVGRHGMVYRYRIVPIDYTSKGMIGALAP